VALSRMYVFLLAQVLERHIRTSGDVSLALYFPPVNLPCKPGSNQRSNGCNRKSKKSMTECA
jgi:hypothetical protein